MKVLAKGLMECGNSIETIFSDDVALSPYLRGMNDADFIALESTCTIGLYKLSGT